MELISRKEAKEKGLKYYFTGIPCKNGHISKRFVGNYICLRCITEWKQANRDNINSKQNERRSKNKEGANEWARTFYANNREKLNEKNKVWHRNNREHLRNYETEYRINNPKYVERKNERVRNYKKENPEKVNFLGSKRRAIKKKALPFWANLEKIREIYLNCPKGYHVDHIIPLQGENVCGLHVENNLQYLTAEENLKKGNKF